MTSVVEICNMALGFVRGQSINSIDQSTLSAQLCKLYYPICRDILLEEVSWGFSRRIVALAVLTDEVFNWAYIYQYPNDCLVINNLVRNFGFIGPVEGEYFSPTAARWSDIPYKSRLPKAEYQINSIGTNKVILANESNLRIDYRAKITNTTMFTSQFTGALIQLLASHIAIPLIGMKDGVVAKREAEAAYQMLLNAAAVNNANEQHRDTPESDFITIRG